jgi:hypothetical protein
MDGLGGGIFGGGAVEGPVPELIGPAQGIWYVVHLNIPALIPAAGLLRLLPRPIHDWLVQASSGTG